MAICPPSGTLCLLSDSYVYVKATYIYATDRYINDTDNYINAKDSLYSAIVRLQDLLYTTVADFTNCAVAVIFRPPADTSLTFGDV